ncbi:hypothetical protein [Yersinia enterocolitica]|uniref:hypothetical protein n=1 Tax=Yersinia enterocolitica TaxID=630 RepID=UPI0005E26CC3|nr:hypothetical protein [Yersinia enterocolitica]ELW7402715.1 hypothetical protein [Yersinia enterocolitica]CFQ78130.1 Uncharacterised protein [Yersinia enterocolitica]
MEKELVSQLITAGAALFGSLVGIFGGFFSTKHLTSLTQRREASNIENGLTAEVLSIAAVWRIDELHEMFKTLLTPSNLKPSDWPRKIVRHIPKGMNVIFESNVSKIGMIRPELASLVIQFHQSMNAIEVLFMAKRSGFESVFTDHDAVRVFNFICQAKRHKDGIIALAS